MHHIHTSIYSTYTITKLAYSNMSLPVASSHSNWWLFSAHILCKKPNTHTHTYTQAQWLTEVQARPTCCSNQREGHSSMTSLPHPGGWGSTAPPGLGSPSQELASNLEERKKQKNNKQRKYGLQEENLWKWSNGKRTSVKKKEAKNIFYMNTKKFFLGGEMIWGNSHMHSSNFDAYKFFTYLFIFIK